MGDTSARMSSLDTAPLSPTNHIPPSPVHTLVSQGEISPVMPDQVSQSLRETSDEETSCLQKIQAIEARRLQSEERHRALLAQLAAHKKEDEENRCILDDLRKQQEQAALRRNKLLQVKRAERQEQFRHSITDEVISELSKLAETDPELQTAIDLVASNEGEKSHYQTLKNCLIDEMMGSENEIWHFLALKVLENESGYIAQLPTNRSPPREAHDGDKITASSTDQDQETDNGSNQVSQEVKLTSAGVQDDSHVYRAEQSLRQPDIADDVGNTSDGLDLDITATTPQQVADMVDTSSFKISQNTEKDNPEALPKIKNEDNADMCLPSAKRLKLKDTTDSSRFMQLQYSTTNPSRDVEHGLTTQVSNCPTIPARGRGSVVRSGAGSKRSRDEASVDSRLSKSTPSVVTPKQTAKPNHEGPPAVRALKRRLDECASNGINVLPQLNCQKCGKAPQKPSVTSCSHLYCTPCLSNLRKGASKADDEVRCTTCSFVIGRKANHITSELLDEWKKEYADDDGNDDNSDSVQENTTSEDIETASATGSLGEDDD